MLVLLTILTVWLATIPVDADEAAAPREIGRYDRLFGSDPLTEDHVADRDEGFAILAPALAQNMWVQADYISGRISYWSADQPFTVESGRVQFQTSTAEVRPFSATSDPVFSYGSPHSVLFSERPMWISVEQTSDGIRLEMEDGDSTGQKVLISRAWLEESQIEWPGAVHEDGSALPMTLSEDRSYFILEVPHFSWVLLTSSDIDIFGKKAGLVVPHSGETRWYKDLKRLTVEVENETVTYEVWVEKSWIDGQIPYPKARGREWVVDQFLGKSYYVTTFLAEESPATLVIQPHLIMKDVEGAVGDDLYQDTKLLNLSSLRAALNAGNVILDVLGERTDFVARSTSRNIEWSSGVENGTYLQEMYELVHDGSDEAWGQIVLDRNFLSIAVTYNATGSQGNYLGTASGAAQTADGLLYHEVQFFNPVNLSVSIKSGTNTTESPLVDPVVRDRLKQKMTFWTVLDYEAILEVQRLDTSATSPESVCKWATSRWPLTTNPFGSASVSLDVTKCRLDWNNDKLIPDSSAWDTIELAYNAGKHLNAYRDGFKNNMIPNPESHNVDVISILTGYRMSSGSSKVLGMAYKGPSHLTTEDKPGRYAVSSVHRDFYANEGTRSLEAVTLVINHELAHNLRADHYWAADDVPCDRTQSSHPARGDTVMHDRDPTKTQYAQYCWIFSDERHVPIRIECGQQDDENPWLPSDCHNAGRINYGALIYSQERSKWW